MDKMQGRCPYCGQMQIITPYDLTDLGADETELDWAAAQKCRCPQAERRRGIDAAHKAIDEVCVKRAKERHMTALKDDQVRGIKALAEQVWDGGLDTVTFRVDAFDTVRLKLKGGTDGVRIAVKRTVKLEAMAE